MFKALSVLLCIAASVAAMYPGGIYSAGRNTGMNAYSPGALVNQQDIQNVYARGPYGYPYYPGYHPGNPGGYHGGYYPNPYDPYYYGYPSYGYAPRVAPPPPYYPPRGDVYSGSNNYGANVYSSDSAVQQNGIQNAQMLA